MIAASFLTVLLPNGERRKLPVTPANRIQWDPTTGEVWIDYVLVGKRDTKLDLSWQSLVPTVTLSFRHVEPELLDVLQPYPDELPAPPSIQRLQSR